jgi:hypothetical protein
MSTMLSSTIKLFEECLMQFSAAIHNCLAQRNNNIYVLKMIHGSGNGSSGLLQVTGVWSVVHPMLCCVSVPQYCVLHG